MTTSQNDRPVVGFVGLGDQGLPMAVAIHDAGYELHTWTRRPEAAADATARGFHAHGSIEDLAAAVDVLALCVTDDAAVLDLARRSLPTMRVGSVLINNGTGTPATAEQLTRMGTDADVLVLDAPVSGGRPAAEAHELATLVGGPDAALRIAEPVLSSFSSRIVHLGGAGAGQRAKLLNNTLMLLNQRAAHDILTLAARIGLDVPSVVNALRAGSAGSRAIELLGTMIRPETAGHLTEVLDLDLDVFRTAMAQEASIEQDDDARALVTRILDEASAGSHGLTDAVALLG